MINTTVQKISKAESWLLASRPKTLPAAVVPVLMGTSVAIHDGYFEPEAAFVTLLCSMLIQIATNYVNDLYDYLKGSDTETRTGPDRALTNGLISVKEMKIGIFFTFGLTFVLGLYLVYLAGLPILIIGILSIGAGYAYTAGPFPLAYNGLGDIFVFVFFGFVGTVGTYYVQALQITPFIYWASVPVGALITNILVVNNYRDREEDKLAGKNTLAVKFGAAFTRLQYSVFTVITYSIPILFYFFYENNLWIFLPMLSLPYAVILIKMIYTLEGEALNKTLAQTAKLSFIYGLLFAIGILV